MANMIIKPAADGNLLIQDRAGGAVLSTSTSGATLADGIALGTPASGTLTNATFPAGHVIQVKRIYLKNTADNANLSYATSGSALSGTLDSNGIYRLVNADSEYMTIPNFSATSGNLLVAWGNYLGIGSPASASNFSYGIEWGSASLRTWSSQGYNNNAYTHGHFFMTSTVLSSNLSSVNVHGLLRIEEQNKTQKYRFTVNTTNVANWGTEGDSAQTQDISMTIMEIQQ